MTDAPAVDPKSLVSSLRRIGQPAGQAMSIWLRPYAWTLFDARGYYSLGARPVCRLWVIGGWWARLTGQVQA